MQAEHLLEGERPTLDEVLKTRENRSRFQNALALKNPGMTVIALKLNIPGPVKNNDAIMKIFRIGVTDLKEILQDETVSVRYEKIIDLSTGPEAYLVADENILKVKKLMIMLEDCSILGRLYDLDVYTFEDDEIITFSRSELGHEERTCLICDRPAKECGRNRTHSVEAMHRQIADLLKKEKRYE